MNIIANPNKWLYQFLSTDVKPTTLPYDSICQETDTGDYYIYTPTGWEAWTGDWGNSTDLVANIDTVTTNTGTLVTLAQQGATSVSQDSSANSVLTMTVAGVSGQSHYLYSFGVTISGAALSTTVTITILNGSTTVYKAIMGAGSPIGEARFRVFSMPIKMTAANALVLNVTAGGTSVVSTGNLCYLTR